MEVGLLKEKVVNRIEELKEELFEVSDYIHGHPEYNFEEYLSSRILEQHLENHGFKVERGIAGLDTAFKAVCDSGKSGFDIGLFGEYDAVKGLGHACGHNIMGTVALGAGIAVSSIIHETGGKVSVFGTPAEEGGGGKILMLEKGAFNGLDAAMILHPASDTVVNDISYSRTDVEVDFYGKASHAATFPDEGTSALNPLLQLFNMVNAMGLELMGKGKIIGVITMGGEDPIIIPDHCQARFTIRSFSMKHKLQLLERFLGICRAVAEATGTRLEYKDLGLPYEDIRNNEVIEKLLENNFLKLGEAVAPRERELGIGCTDMGNVTHVIPSLQSYVGVAKGMRGHTREFMEAAGDERGRRAILTGAKAMAMTAVDLLASQENMALVRAAFKRMKDKFE